MNPAELLSSLETTRRHGCVPDEHASSAASQRMRERARRDEVRLLSAMVLADAIRAARPDTLVVYRWEWTAYAFLVTLIAALMEAFALVRILGGAP